MRLGSSQSGLNGLILNWFDGFGFIPKQFEWPHLELVQWVWVHPETAWMASSWTGALVATCSLWPIPWPSHCAFVCFALLSVVFCLDFNPFCFLLLFPCRVFFLLFIYLFLSWFPQSINAQFLQTECLSCQPTTKVLPTCELHCCKGTF
jgi:hypothetical protein